VHGAAQLIGTRGWRERGENPALRRSTRPTSLPASLLRDDARPRSANQDQCGSAGTHLLERARDDGAVLLGRDRPSALLGVGRELGLAAAGTATSAASLCVLGHRLRVEERRVRRGRWRGGGGRRRGSAQRAPQVRSPSVLRPNPAGKPPKRRPRSRRSGRLSSCDEGTGALRSSTSSRRPLQSPSRDLAACEVLQGLEDAPLCRAMTAGPVVARVCYGHRLGNGRHALEGSSICCSNAASSTGNRPRTHTWQPVRDWLQIQVQTVLLQVGDCHRQRSRRRPFVAGRIARPRRSGRGGRRHRPPLRPRRPPSPSPSTPHHSHRPTSAGHGRRHDGRHAALDADPRGRAHVGPARARPGARAEQDAVSSPRPPLCSPLPPPLSFSERPLDPHDRRALLSALGLAASPFSAALCQPCVGQNKGRRARWARRACLSRTTLELLTRSSLVLDGTSPAAAGPSTGLSRSRCRSGRAPASSPPPPSRTQS